MIHSSIDPQTQANICILGKIDDFFSRFNIASSMHRCGIRKRRGHSVRSLIRTIFTLPFVGKNFFRGIVVNQEIIDTGVNLFEFSLNSDLLDELDNHDVSKLKNNLVCADINGGHDVKWNRYPVRLIVIV